MEARPRKRTGYMRGEMRSGGECAGATEMPATATAAAVKAATAAAVKTATAAAVKTAATAAMKTAATAAMASAAPAAFRAGIRRGGQQHRASERGNA
jgi:hypothetical protein